MSRDGHPSVLVVQHVASEGPGLLGEELIEAGFQLRILAPDAPLPETALGEARGLVILGGPKERLDDSKNPRIAAERTLMHRAIDAKVPLIALGRGAELLASTLGSQLTPLARPEIGWFEVQMDPNAPADPVFQRSPPKFSTFHWHSDTFDLPKGAVHLASSVQTPHQAFSYRETAWGLLFHLEVDFAQIEAMVREAPQELVAAGLDADALLAASRMKAFRMGALSREVYQQWSNLLQR